MADFPVNGSSVSGLVISGGDTVEVFGGGSTSGTIASGGGTETVTDGFDSGSTYETGGVLILSGATASSFNDTIGAGGTATAFFRSTDFRNTIASVVLAS